MSRRAWAYVVGVIASAGLVSGLLWLWSPPPNSQVLTFATLVVLATLAQLFTARAPSHQSYHVTLIFLSMGTILLDPAFFILLVAIPHLIEWVKERWVSSSRLRKWYLQPFNIAAHILAGLAARAVFLFLGGDIAQLVTIQSVIALIATALMYLILNHLFVGMAIVWARGVPLRESGILDWQNLGSDGVLLLTGAVASVLWTINPWLVLPALSPIVLMFQALQVPQLKKEATTDTKTGLANARHFSKLYLAELERARRFNRPLAVLMGDLDLLRNINNLYGHLAGDQVLGGIGRIIRETVREYDIAGRFGGEEFAIILPETDSAGALELAERLRSQIAGDAFPIPTSTMPISVTMSIGVACFPDDGMNANDLIHQADIAVYQAKLQGRNRVVHVRDVPHSARLRGVPNANRLDLPDTPTAPPAEPRGNRPSPPAQHGLRATETSRTPTPATKANRIFQWYVTSIITFAVLATVAGFLWGRPQDSPTLGLLVLLAVITQLPVVKNIYEDSSISASMAVNFAAGLLLGIPAVACVSALIAFVHYIQRRPSWYKTLFNWSAHTLAGVVPAILVLLIPEPFRMPEMVLLALLAVPAALAYYLIETGSISIAIALANGTSPIRGWKEQSGWLGPHYVVLALIGLFFSMSYAQLGLPGVALFLMPIVMLSYSQRQYVSRTAASINELKRVNQELAIANREVSTAAQVIHQLNEELLLTLAKIIDARDPYVLGHSAKVAEYATVIARALGLPQQQVEHVRQAGFMHDIGKFGIPESLLHNPARLSGEEYAQIKTHSQVGANFLETCAGLRQLAPFVKYHHEWWNGNGYPERLAGEQIPREARILALADAVEAMASDRPYHRAMFLSEIIAEIENCGGTQFDPIIAHIFVNILRQDGKDLVVNSARRVTPKQGRRVFRMAPFSDLVVSDT